MSKNNIHFHDKIKKNPKMSLNIYFLGLSEEFSGTQKRVRISYCKQVIGVRDIETFTVSISYKTVCTNNEDLD